MKAFCMSKEEVRKFLEEDGFLVIPDAVPPDHVERACRAVDLHAARLADPRYPNVNIADALGLDPAFLELIDLPKVLPKIWALLGWNIWVHHSHFNRNPPGAPAPTGAPFEYFWHRDGGAIHRDLAGPAPLLLAKVAFYLTEVGREDGPTWVVKGSHLTPDLPASASLPAEAFPIEARPGTAVIYHNRLVHSLQSPNSGARTRRAVFIQYGYRWMAGMDPNTVAHLAGSLSEVRRQLCGLAHTWSDGQAKGRSGRYYPRAPDVPLRAFIEELLGEDAPQFVARSADARELNGQPYRF